MKRNAILITLLTTLTCFALIKTPDQRTPNSDISLDPATATCVTDLEKSLQQISKDLFANDIFNRYVQAVADTYQIKPIEALETVLTDWVQKCAKSKIQSSASR